MRKLSPISSQAFCIGIGVLFVVLTAVFVLVPYSLERHPWEQGASMAATTTVTAS
jgi:hypothetical protein